MGTKVTPGSKVQFSAEFVNKLVDLTSKAEGHSLQDTFSEGVSVGWIYVRNDTGVDKETGAILGLLDGDGSLINPETSASEEVRFKYSEKYVSAVAPIEFFDQGSFCVLLEPIASGAIGRAAISGVVPVPIYLMDVYHLYAKATDSTSLTSNESNGLPIVWADRSGTAPYTTWGYVRLGTPYNGRNEYVVLNGYGSLIPAWSVVEITAINEVAGLKIYTVSIPSAADLPAGKLLFVGETGISASDYGIAYSAYDCTPYHYGDADETTGTCGTVEDSFYLDAAQTGFVSPGGVGGLIAVRPFSSGKISHVTFMPSNYSSGSITTGATEYISSTYDLGSIVTIPDYVSTKTRMLFPWYNYSGIQFTVSYPSVSTPASAIAQWNVYIRFHLDYEEETIVEQQVFQNTISRSTAGSNVSVGTTCVIFNPLWNIWYTVINTSEAIKAISFKFKDVRNPVEMTPNSFLYILNGLRYLSFIEMEQP